MAQIFVSYSRKDSKIIDRLIAELEKAGHQVWVDRFGIRGGDKWRGEIVTAIHNADVFLMALSPNSVKSDNVRKELDLADKRKKRILPVKIRPTSIPSTMEYQVAGLQHIDFSSSFDEGLRQLLKAIEDRDTGPLAFEKPVSTLPRMPINASFLIVAGFLAVVVAIGIAAAAFIFLTSSGGGVTTTPDVTPANLSATSEQSTLNKLTTIDSTATTVAAIATAIAATRQAELKSVTPTHAPTPTPTVTFTATPSATPTIATNTPTFQPTPTPTKAPGFVIEDFEAFGGNLADDFEINRNAGNEGQVTLVGVPHINQGRQALALEFDIRDSLPNHYIGFDRALPTQDWSGYASLCFWIESDGSNRSLVLQFGESKYKFWKKIYSLSNGTGDYCISLNDPHQINLRSVGYYGVYVEGPPTGQSIIYIDNIRLLN